MGRGTTNWNHRDTDPPASLREALRAGVTEKKRADKIFSAKAESTDQCAAARFTTAFPKRQENYWQEDS
jgi:hypothetical protein